LDVEKNLEVAKGCYFNLIFCSSNTQLRNGNLNISAGGKPLFEMSFKILQRCMLLCRNKYHYSTYYAQLHTLQKHCEVTFQPFANLCLKRTAQCSIWS